MNIIPLIIEHLATHRRLVVPQLGAFIRKSEGGEILFSEMLKRDDGVLRELLCRHGASELEAVGSIDRFIFELRHTVESGSVFQAEGLGVFAADSNGNIRFRHLPTATPEEHAATSTPQPVAKPEPEEESKPAEEVPSPAEPKAVPQQETPSEVTRENEEEHSADLTRRRIKSLMRFESEHPREPRSSSQPHRDPALRNLSYGKPQKTTDAFTYVNSAPSRRPDKFIILAIAAVVIALGAILYGYIKDRKQERIEQQYLEQMSLTIDSEGANAIPQE